MKSNFFKAFVLPVLVAGAAVLSAFGTAGKSNSALLANEHGWIRTAPNTCQESDLCNQQVSTMCTVGNAPGGTQLFRKNGSGDCVIPLYKPLPTP
ncbi:hypothetical protein ACHRVK_03690 [Flavobacterium plurextorum]|uniref:hypothetical protein n=1 Tax=Flavobacterium plurextorum TaxID=1114867 RepID=UPI003756C415